MTHAVSPAGPPPATSGRQRWLLAFNCQAIGLANCLSMLSNDIVVETYDSASFGPHRDDVLARLDGFDRVLLAPGIEKHFALDLGERDNVWRLPALTFSGFHPDFCILSQDGELAGGPLGLYHSALAWAAFRHGLDEKRTAGLFGTRAFRALGYFDRWSKDRDQLLAAYRASGFDLGPSFVGWSRRGTFMHASNRPKIGCLQDVARLVLARAGLTVRESDHLPPDNLASGPACPVYPDIAARLGVRGSYFFKEDGRCALLDLEQFIAASFDLYRRCPAPDELLPNFRHTLGNAMAYVETLR